jgi:phage gp29-like protein
MFTTIKNAVKNALGIQSASRNTDPNFFYNALQFLPNPDPILRKLGKNQEVYDAIIADAHVIGELRPMRANVITYQWRIVTGGDKPEDKLAFELAQKLYSKNPAPNISWADVFWNMHEAVLRGYRVHEVVWESVDGQLIPTALLDRPNRRFVYGTDNELRLLTRDNPALGEPVDNYKFLVSRHMPSFDNPYGVALLSSCFWPYTFKHGGFRFFYKYCEKYGIPWAVGKYPQGSTEATINELADRLSQMIEDAVAAIPSDGSVELVENSGGGSQLPQERLIEICNREMSKALNSQTLASEVLGQGSYAAAEVHRGREQDNGAADRAIIVNTNNQLLQWLTELNYPNAAPPSFEFYDEAEARGQWVDVFDKTRAFLQIPTQFAHERLQIPMPVGGEEVLPSVTATAPALPANFSASFSQPPSNDLPPNALYAQQLAQCTSKIIDDWVNQARTKTNSIDDLKKLGDEFVAMYPDMSIEELTNEMGVAFATSVLAGQFDVLQEVQNDENG